MSKSALKSIASILYRGLLGYVVANVITGAYVGLIVVIGLMGYLDALRATSLEFVLMCALGASSIGGLFAAICASLFAPTPTSGKGRTWALVKRACIGNVLGIIVAAHFGATFATVVDFVYGQVALKKWGEDFVLLPMAIGGGAGIIARVLCGFWGRFRRRPH